ncbi:MAG: diacylglycerol kinase family protein [Hyphomicrobium sp.]
MPDRLFQTPLRDSPLTASSALRRRFMLIHNPIAGVANRSLLNKVMCLLKSRGAEVVLTSTPLREALRDPVNTDAIIAAGGDGTIRALAAVTGDLPVGIIPVGTANVFAREIGLAVKAAVVADVLMSGPVVEIEGATANGVPFFLMAGAGFDGEVVARLDTGLKRSFGRAAYALPIIRTLRTDPVPLRVKVDGTTHVARWVIATRARHYAGSFRLAAGRSCLMNPGFDVVLIKGMDVKIALRQLMSLSLGRLAREHDVEFLSATELEIESDAPVACQVDGDKFGHLPLSIKAGGPRFRLIVPEAFAAQAVSHSPTATSAAASTSASAAPL